MKPCGLSQIVIIFVLFSSFALAQEGREAAYETAMTMGSFQLETGEYRSAVENFKKALALKAGEKAAMISLGIAYSRARDYANARSVFFEALAADRSNPRIRYELGAVLYKLGDTEGARGQFTSVYEGPADETLKAAAREYLDIIAAEREKKIFSLDVLTGFQYDSNVILDPANPVIPGRKQADGRFLAVVNGKYKFLDSQKTAADADYSLYQSLHNTLSDFNVRQHNIRLSGRYDATEKTRFDLRYGFSYALVGGDKYSAVHQIRPAASFGFSLESATEFFYAYETKKFYDSGLFPANSGRNGNSNAAGVSHTIVLGGQSAVTAGYAYDRDSTDRDFWDYRGNKGFVSFQAGLSAVKVSLAASYYDKKYEGIITGFTEKRHDGTQEYSLTLERKITKNVSLDLSDLYISNDSNLAPYEYTRNIVSLVAVMRL